MSRSGFVLHGHESDRGVWAAGCAAEVIKFRRAIRAIIDTDNENAPRQGSIVEIQFENVVAEKQGHREIADRTGECDRVIEVYVAGVRKYEAREKNSERHKEVHQYRRGQKPGHQAMRVCAHLLVVKTAA